VEAFLSKARKRKRERERGILFKGHWLEGMDKRANPWTTRGSVFNFERFFIER